MDKFLTFFKIHEPSENFSLLKLIKKFATGAIMSAVKNQFLFSMVATFFLTAIIVVANFTNELSYIKRKKVYFLFFYTF